MMNRYIRVCIHMCLTYTLGHICVYLGVLVVGDVVADVGE